MKYVSTRDKARQVDAAQAIVAGLSREGGLYVPEDFPSFAADRIESMAGMPYAARAAEDGEDGGQRVAADPAGVCDFWRNGCGGGE